MYKHRKTKSSSYVLWFVLLLVGLVSRGPELLSEVRGNAGMMMFVQILAVAPDPSAFQIAAQATRLLRQAEAYTPKKHFTWQELDFASVTQDESNEVALFIDLGDRALRAGLYTQAYACYTLVASVAPPSELGFIFRTAVAATLAGSDQTPQWLEAVHDQDETFVVYTLKDAIKIEGKNFRRIISALDPINVLSGESIGHTENDFSGILWTNGEALSIVSVARTGNYLLQTRLRHRGTSPILVEIGVDGQRVDFINLGRGDYSWETFKVPVVLKQGSHTIHIWFRNDVWTESESRDAEIAWVEIRRQK